MARFRVLIVKLDSGGLLDRIFEAWHDHPDIELATDAPVGLAPAIDMLRNRQALDVVLLLGPQTEVRTAAEQIRDIRRSVHIVSIADDERGGTNVLLPDAGFAELSQIVVAMGQAPRYWFSRGKVRWLRSLRNAPPRSGDGGERSDPGNGDERPDGDAANDDPVQLPVRATLPALRREKAAPEVVAILTLALTWAERATLILLASWKGERQPPAGFGLSWDAIERWLGALAKLFDDPAEPAEQAFRELEDRLRSEEGQRTPLGRLFGRLGHDRLALKLFLIVVAGELDVRFQRLFGELHDNFGRRYPSLTLACAIIAASLSRTSPAEVRGQIALKHGLRVLGILGGPAAPFEHGDDELRAPPPVIDWLLGAGPESLFEPLTPLLRTIPEEIVDLVPAGRVRLLRGYVRRALAGAEGQAAAAVVLGGSDPRWITVEASAIDPGALHIDGNTAAMPAAAIEAAVAQAITAANLEGRRLVVTLDHVDPAADPLWLALSRRLDRTDRHPFILSPNPAGVLAAAPGEMLAVADLPPPAPDERRLAFARALAGYGEAGGAVAAELATRLPLALADLPHAVSLALAEASANGRPLHPVEEDWFAGFRRAAAARLPSMARRVEPVPATAEEREAGAGPLARVILPETEREELRELVTHARYGRVVTEEFGFARLLDGKGVGALFSGPSGTGKTTAAHAVASELDADLYVIDLSQVVSKYIGETEKNLEVVFAEAESAGAVLLFDEADALFGKRSAVSNAHDRYANIEVAYLLQRMQLFAGLAILTTNNAANVDPAFARRLRFAIEFPRPAASDRLAIWEQSLPAALRAGALPLRSLAFALDVTGGTIRQMAFHAAVLAAGKGGTIGVDELLAGARSQLIRLGQFEDVAKLEAIAAGERIKAAA